MAGALKPADGPTLFGDQPSAARYVIAGKLPVLLVLSHGRETGSSWLLMVGSCWEMVLSERHAEMGRLV